MSVQSMTLVLEHSESTGTARCVLIAIANHDGDGGAWPSVATIAREARTSERSAQAHIRTLVELGELAVEYNAGGTHRTRNDQRPNRYDIVLRCPSNCDGSTAHRLSDPQTNGVQVPAPREVDGVQVYVERGAGSRTNGVQDPAPEPSLNHQGTKTSTKRSTVTVLDARFDDFWDAYAHKMDRGHALKAWRAALRRGVDADAIIDAAAAFRTKTITDGTEARFIPRAATWLNGERYADQAPAKTSNPDHRPVHLVEQAPDGLTDTEYLAWQRGQYAGRLA